jgi:two-component system, OmpR family, sensor kinase
VSIRLRMTLFYTAILVLTLTAFSSILYVAQDRYTLDIVKQDLTESAAKMVIAWTRFHRTYPRPLPWMLPPGGDPRSSDDNPADAGSYGDEAWQAMQVMVRGAAATDVLTILDPAGEPVPRANGERVEAIPISAEGMRSLQTGEGWIEIAQGEDSRWLTLSRPVLFDNANLGILQVARPLADRDRSMNSLGATLIAGTAVATVVAFGAGWFLSGTMLRPIQKITETAEQIGEASDLTARVEHRGPNDELGRLAKTFNSMLGRLEEAYQQIEHALQVQRDFVADVSHELRTPLTTIRGNLTLLQHDPPLPKDEQTDIVEDLAAESERLSRMVSDLLTLARADAGRKFAMLPMAISGIVDDVCRQAHILAPERTIECECPKDLAAVTNADALKQTLLILMDNAIKHGEGPIRLSVDRRDHQVAIRVQDSGPGMSEELRKRIFHRFYRGDASRTTPGFGLGLSIARTLVEAQNGTLNIESEVGKSSTFTVLLPAAE